MSGPPRSLCRDLSIDQRSKKIFEDNNTNTLGRSPESDIIPKLKDDIVLLIERLMTYKIEPETAIALVEKYGPKRVKYVVEQLSKRYEKVKPGLLVTALERNYIWPAGGAGMTAHITSENSISRRHAERETRITFEKTDLMMKKRASNDVGESHLKILRSKLGR